MLKTIRRALRHHAFTPAKDFTGYVRYRKGERRKAVVIAHQQIDAFIPPKSRHCVRLYSHSLYGGPDSEFGFLVWEYSPGNSSTTIAPAPKDLQDKVQRRLDNMAEQG